jgi:hypothetical protein
MPWWIPIVTAVAAGIILFFLLPTLEPARSKLLSWVGIKKPASAQVVPEKPVLPPTQTEEVPSSAIVDPGMIYAAIRQAPVLQRREVAKHYEGIKVEWTGKLFTITELPAGKLRITACWSTRFTESFVFEVNVADYPGIGLLKDDDPIRVKGTIKDVEIPYPINLKDVTLVEYGVLKK